MPDWRDTQISGSTTISLITTSTGLAPLVAFEIRRSLGLLSPVKIIDSPAVSHSSLYASDPLRSWIDGKKEIRTSSVS